MFQYFLIMTDKKHNPAQKLKARNRSIVHAIKEHATCADCNIGFPYYQMDFHHVSGVKVNKVSAMVSESSEKLLEEISKCIILCKNCHATRHHIKAQQGLITRKEDPDERVEVQQAETL